MPFVSVEVGVYKLTPLSWLSEAAKKVQFEAVDLLNARSNPSKNKTHYGLRYGLYSMPII
jgi:hypothetical protein